MDRNAQNAGDQRRYAIVRRAKTTPAVAYFNMLSSQAVLWMTESVLPEQRDRLYPLTVAQSMFMR